MDGLGDQDDCRDGVDETREEGLGLTVIPLGVTTGESVLTTVRVPAL